MRHFSKAVFGFAECRGEAAALARALKARSAEVSVHRFPDGESLVRVPAAAKDAILYRPLHHPNPKLVEVIFALSALRANGAKRIILVAPYLPYMRQDKVFWPCEALSQKVLGTMLSRWCDVIVAVEPHLHRTRTITGVFPGRRGVAVSGALALARYFKGNGIAKDTFVLGPDEEAYRSAQPFAEALRLQWGTAVKKRRGDNKVAVRLPNAARLKGRPVLIVDDVISTGATVIAAASVAKRAGATSVAAAVVHALYDRRAAQAIKRAGIRSVVSCDGVPHPSNKVALAPDLAAAIKALR